MKHADSNDTQTLTNNQAQQIIKLYSTGEWSHKRLAEKFGVTPYQIRKDVKGIVKPKPTALQRFDAKWTEDENGCHVWNGYKSKSGYGQFRMNGKIYHAHRASYELKRRTLAPDEVVRHKCDNPCCVNVDHLEAGTPWDNNHDKIQRFRQPWQYPAIDYLAMLFYYEAGLLSLDEISERYGIKKDTLKRRLKDMSEKAGDPFEDKVFYYRDRAIKEETERGKINPPLELVIDRIIE